MNARTVLVTAFEPFGGERVNASWEAARLIDGWRCGDAVVVVQILPCVYKVCISVFVETVERTNPRAVVMTGQAARRGIVSVERFARNHASTNARDASGALGADVSGPPLIEATAPVAAIARAIRKAGVAARISTDAGDYVCNHLYYGALQGLAAAAPAPAAVFIHLPATPEQSPANASARRLVSGDAVRALQAAVGVLLR